MECRSWTACSDMRDTDSETMTPKLIIRKYRSSDSKNKTRIMCFPSHPARPVKFKSWTGAASTSITGSGWLQTSHVACKRKLAMGEVLAPRTRRQILRACEAAGKLSGRVPMQTSVQEECFQAIVALRSLHCSAHERTIQDFTYKAGRTSRFKFLV